MEMSETALKALVDDAFERGRIYERSIADEHIALMAKDVRRWEEKCVEIRLHTDKEVNATNEYARSINEALVQEQGKTSALMEQNQQLRDKVSKLRQDLLHHVKETT